MQISKEMFQCHQGGERGGVEKAAKAGVEKAAKAGVEKAAKAKACTQTEKGGTPCRHTQYRCIIPA
jgi:hypothetical protein